MVMGLVTGGGGGGCEEEGCMRCTVGEGPQGKGREGGGGWIGRLLRHLCGEEPCLCGGIGRATPHRKQATLLIKGHRGDKAVMGC